MIVNIREHGFVRLFSTSIHGELGTDVEVEISAAGVSEAGFAEIGVVIRAVGHRLPTSVAGDGLGSMLNALTQEVGKSPLSQLVRETVGVVERHYIEAALQLTRGNRTLTAELLGLSRQSLYAKLDRYGLDGDNGFALRKGRGSLADA
jgi:transcriptional regulator PpsR